MALRHIHLSGAAPARYVTYAQAVVVQTELQRALLSWKASGPARSSPPPSPTLISFTPSPTYTLGRRQTTPLGESELARLQAPLSVQDEPTEARAAAGGDAPVEGDYSRASSSLSSSSSSSSAGSSALVFRPEVLHSPRGGQTTYHGPGQLVFWPVIDLHSALHRRFTVRDYACALEKTTIAFLRRLGVQGFTTEDPGVWTWHRNGSGQDDGENGRQGLLLPRTTTQPSGAGGNAAAAVSDARPVGETAAPAPVAAEDVPGREARKIAAMGVHLRRHVTGLGVAVNLSMPVTGPEVTNPWARIVACGLEGKSVTSVAAETGQSWSTLLETPPSTSSSTTTAPGATQPAPALTTAGKDSVVTEHRYRLLASEWAQEFAKHLGVAGPKLVEDLKVEPAV